MTTQITPPPTPGGYRYAHSQAAHYLGITPGTLAKWRSVGHPHVPYYKVGKKIIYHQADLQAYLDRHRAVEVSA